MQYNKTVLSFFFFFFFNDTATTEIYTLSLHDALPISIASLSFWSLCRGDNKLFSVIGRSEEHTSELQSLTNLVCRLLLEKKKKKIKKLYKETKNNHKKTVITYNIRVNK